MKAASVVVLRGGRLWREGGLEEGPLAVALGRVVAEPSGAGEAAVADVAGSVVLPGLVNAHDHLDASSFPPLGRPPYASVYAWTADVGVADAAAAAAALSVPLPDRLFLGGLRNLLAGVTAVVHHGAFHRSLSRTDFPVRVLSRYQFAHAPGLTPKLRRTYRTTDRRIPWIVHAGEGTDERCRKELALLEEANVLRQNTVVVHGIAFGAEEARRLAAARACLVWSPESNRRLYGATADVALFRAEGVRVGLGSDSAATGTRDLLSTLAAARAERALGDAELVSLATSGSAEVARLPAGGTRPGAAADLVVARSVEDLLAGDRRAVRLVMVAGRVRYGEPELLDALGVRWAPISVDGTARALESGLARRAAALLKRDRGKDGARWSAGLAVD